MEPQSSPDNNRTPRGLSRFWPVHREAGDPADTAEHPEISVVLPGEPQMVALGSRRTDQIEPGTSDPLAPPVHGSPVPLGGFAPPAPFASARPPTGGPDGANPSSGPGMGGPLPLGGGPAGGQGKNPGGGTGGSAPADNGPRPGGAGERPAAREGDPDHYGASDPGEDAAQDVESRRANPWDRDSGTFGGFGLSGRNGRFLFGGRDTPGEPRAGEPTGANGHSVPELNGRARTPGDEASTLDDPAPGEPADDTVPAQASDENGRDDMNGRAGVPGFTAPGNPVPSEDGPAPEQAAPEARRQATGWASVPTSTHPVVTPTSGAPVSSAPVSPGFNAPVSPGFGSPVSPSFVAPVSPGGFNPPAYGQPPSYAPALPDPDAGPVSGVPAPRAGATPPAASAAAPAPAADAPVSAQPAQPAPEAPRPAVTQPTMAQPTVTQPTVTQPAVTQPAMAQPAVTQPTVTPPTEPSLFGSSSAETIAAVRVAAEEAARRAWDDDPGLRPPAPRRSASLEDAEPVRRGRRAAEPDDDDQDQEMRPGDVEAGHIAFWDDDATRHFRAAWHEVKAEFVDDPERALTRAHDLLTDAVNELTESLLAERDELDPLRGDASPDTESMRMAMRGYREFLDRILAL
jgi:hypothetical protein